MPSFSKNPSSQFNQNPSSVISDDPWWMNDFFIFHHPQSDISSFWPAFHKNHARSVRENCLFLIFPLTHWPSTNCHPVPWLYKSPFYFNVFSWTHPLSPTVMPHCYSPNTYCDILEELNNLVLMKHWKGFLPLTFSNMSIAQNKHNKRQYREFYYIWWDLFKMIYI